ncbi:MAG: N-acetylmuramoyl-L-alanine amidase [bacterium]
MKLHARLLILFCFLFLFDGCAFLRSITGGNRLAALEERTAELNELIKLRQAPLDISPLVRIQDVKIDSARNKVLLRFNNELSYLPLREESVQQLYSWVTELFGSSLDGYSLSIISLRKPIEELIPNYYRKDTLSYDRTRLAKPAAPRPVPVVQNISKPFIPTKGLFGKNIGLWHSHGWYYNNDVDRWEWQRPRLFTMVEDLLPMSFTLPCLIPMLENAGANVFVPRERDTQIHEVIVDNDSQEPFRSRMTGQWIIGSEKAFRVGNPPYGPGLNPFTQGTDLRTSSEKDGLSTIEWIPAIPETGFYAVYLSYVASESSCTDAHYAVHHLGGVTEFRVNQQIGGNTWQYLGQFKFEQGTHSQNGKVVLSNRSETPGKSISADAVRFGGGMGVIARNGSTSGRPKFVEGSRYYLQYAGMPDSLVFNFSNERNDYRDDYQSRAEYLNYLTGAPSGPNKNRAMKGLGIPIDLSLAFHTDAGITNNDTTIGTLTIYTVESTDNALAFPDSVSRYANRDLADLVQTQIVSDLRAKYDPAWSRRQLRNADYSESRRPNIPSVLVELLSHQNFLDMKFVLDPRFRFDVSRAMYKAIVKFLATQHRTSYCIQPLPVTHFSSEFNTNGNLLLRWKPQSDPLEPTARPTRYIVYSRIDDGGFDNGRLTDTTFALIKDIQPGQIYSFKVTGVNEGGESFPSEILAACKGSSGGSPVLIVNGFDRISGPAAVDAPEFKGFLTDLDAGVPDKYDIGTTGVQHDFIRTSTFRTNDGPGHGASYGDREGTISAGNTFDYPYLHGLSLRAAGLSFVSASDEAVMDSLVDMKQYRFVDLILGKEKKTRWPKAAADTLRGIQFEAFPPKLQSTIKAYCLSGGNLFVSGAYIGSDLFSAPPPDSTGIRFGRETLKFNWLTDHAAKTGAVYSTEPAFLPKGFILEFTTELNERMVRIESPDALVPVQGARQLLRYAENQFGAGVGFKKEYGVVALGFPFETITLQSKRDALMKAVISYLNIAR